MGIGYKTLISTQTGITGIVTSAAVNQVAVSPTVGVDIAQNVSDVINLTGYKGFSSVLNIDVNTPSAVNIAVQSAANVVVASDTIVSAAHGLFTGLKVQVSTDTTLPTGLSAVTDYFVIKIDADTYSLATTLANAIAGTVINITAVGSGTLVTTPTALAGGSYTLQGSNDQEDWITDVAAVNITADAIAGVSATSRVAVYKYYRFYYAITAGSMTIAATSVLNN